MAASRRRLRSGRAHEPARARCAWLRQATGAAARPASALCRPRPMISSPIGPPGDWIAMRPPALPLDRKVVLITGAARRIGAALALAFHERGAAVAVHYRNSRNEAARLVAAMNARGKGSAAGFQADLGDLDALAA